MSDFAKNQLLKFGWTEGKGLGKNENGITQAIKPKLKFDTSGIGHKIQDDQCWSSVFNRAATNIVIDKIPDGVSISVKDNNSTSIYKKKIHNKETSLYNGNFLKMSTLQDGNLVKDSTSQVLEDKEEAKPSYNPFAIMSDEQLFKACSGRTAHKGARHGLTLSGKLARVAEQEKQLILGIKSCKISVHGQERDKKKKKKRTEEVDLPPLDIEDDDDLRLPVQPIYTDENYQPSKKTAKKNKRKIQDLAQQLSKTCSLQDDDKEDDEGDTTSMEPDGKKLKRTARPILKASSCDTADPTHMCEKCEFYDYHRKSFEKHKKTTSERNKRFKKKVSFVQDTDTDDFNMTVKEYKRKGKKKLGLKSTAKEAVKLNGRISKRKNKKLQQKEKIKQRNFIMPATLKIGDIPIRFPGMKIED